MSIIFDGVMKRLYDDAQVRDEFATTRLWEYIIQQAFEGLEWVRASQQPPTTAVHSLRRVDYIVEYIHMQSGAVMQVLFIEAKKHGATETDIRQCESQAWEACMTHSINEGGMRPVWYQTCIGTTSRLWIYDPWREDPIAFLPGQHSLGHLDHYLDISEHGTQIMYALKYISNHREPPAKFLASSPLVSSDGSSSEPAQSPTTATREALTNRAAGQTQIPLHQNHWVHIKIMSDNGGSLYGRSDDGFELRTSKDAWIVQKGKQREGCYVHIHPQTKQAYWTETLEPSQLQPDLGQIPVTSEPSSSKAARRDPEWVHVRVQIVTHITRPDEWIFKDVNNKTRKTLKPEWEKERYEGKDVHVFHSKKASYYW